MNFLTDLTKSTSSIYIRWKVPKCWLVFGGWSHLAKLLSDTVMVFRWSGQHYCKYGDHQSKTVISRQNCHKMTVKLSLVLRERERDQTKQISFRFFTSYLLVVKHVDMMLNLYSRCLHPKKVTVWDESYASGMCVARWTCLGSGVPSGKRPKFHRLHYVFHLPSSSMDLL